MSKKKQNSFGVSHKLLVLSSLYYSNEITRLQRTKPVDLCLKENTTVHGIISMDVIFLKEKYYINGWSSKPNYFKEKKQKIKIISILNLRIKRGIVKFVYELECTTRYRYPGR